LKLVQRVIVLAMLCVAMTMSSALPAFATVKWLSTVVPQTQTKSNWCWAASSSMIIKHFGGTASQSSVVNYIYPNQSYPNYTATDSQADKAIDHYQSADTGNVTATYLSFTAVKYQTNNNGPIYAGWSWVSGGGHATVIRGYDDSGSTYVYWVNPADGLGHKNTYAWFKNDGSHIWDGSIFYK